MGTPTERNLNVLRHRFQAATSELKQAQKACTVAEAAVRKAQRNARAAYAASYAAINVFSAAKEALLAEALKTE